MASEKTYKGKIALKYLKKFPNASTMAISRMVLKDYPLDFNSLEGVRGLIRFYRNEIKNRKPKTTDVTEFERSNQTKKKLYEKTI